MDPHDPFEARQLRALCAMALLSPILRLIPGQAAAVAGRAAWASPLVALPLLLGYVLLLEPLRAAFREGEALPELALRVLGPRAGRSVLLLLGVWLLLGTGLALRTDSERFLVTIYPRSNKAFFAVCLGILGTVAAMGRRRSLLRVARIVEPLLLAALLAIGLVSLKSLDLWELLPLTPADAPGLLRGSLPALDILSFGLLALCLFPVRQEPSPARLRKSLVWTTAMALLMTALGAAVQGRFGPGLSARLSAPFFALVRDLVFFRSLERLEALAVALWIFPDLLLIGMTLRAGQHCLRLALGWRPRPDESRRDLGEGRWLGWLCGAAATALGLVLAPGEEALQLWSARVLPLSTLTVCFLLVPGILAVGKIRKKL